MISKNQIKYVKSLQLKKFRNKHNCFVVETKKNVLEILNSHLHIKMIFALETWVGENKVSSEIEVIEVNRKEMSRISSLKNPSEVLAVVFIPKQKISNEFKGVNIVIDEIKDPGNLGTIIRICDWFAVKNIYLSEKSVDLYNPKVIQSTMGSISRVNLIYTDLNSLILNLPKDIKVYAAVIDGKNINTIEVPNNCFIVFGNESKGISDDLLNIIGNKITINRVGKAESLNVAISTSIILNKFCN